MPFHDALDRRQANTVTDELLLAVQALKRTEQFIGVLRLEPRIVVADDETHQTGSVLHCIKRNLNACGIAVTGELPRIFDQIADEVSQQRSLREPGWVSVMSLQASRGGVPVK